MARLTVQNLAMELRIDDVSAASNVLSFEQLIATQEPRVRRLAHRLLGWRENSADVDDAVQDVFLAALKNLERFRADAAVSTWLTRVTINRCRTHGRRQFVRLRWLRRQSAPANAPAASERPIADETSAKVRSAVQALAARDREVIVLFYLEELPAAEIGALLGISKGAVDVRLHRARQRLKEKLGGLADESL